MKNIMFVCTGNICRSAMAHHYCQSKLYDLKRQNDIVVSSCGTSAVTGDISTKNAISVMKKYEVNLIPHRATSMFDIDVENYDLILCMTEQHIDIDDPWGYNLKIYDACAKEIVECVDRLLEKI